jgi:hypothetical protein
MQSTPAALTELQCSEMQHSEMHCLQVPASGVISKLQV